MDRNKGVLLVFLTALVSGFSIFINKFGVTGINSSTFTFAKNFLVVIFIFAIILFFKEFNDFKKFKKKKWINLALIGFFGGSIPFLLFFKGLQLTTASKSSFIHKTMFLYVIILASIFLKEKISKKIIISAILLLLGNALMLRFVWQAFNLGDLLILTATIFWAIENIISKHILKELNSRIVIFGRMFFGSLFIFIFLLITKQFNFGLNVQQFGWILLTAILLLFYVITWYTGLKYVKVSVATCVLSLGSVITTILDYFFFRAGLSFSQSVGIFLLLIGVILAVGISQLNNIIKNILGWSRKWIHLN